MTYDKAQTLPLGVPWMVTTVRADAAGAGDA